MNIGEKIKAKRKEKGYSIKDVVTEASLGGTSRKADIARLERIEDGRDHPTFKQLRELRSALDLDLNKIIKGDLKDEIDDWSVFNNNCRKLYLENDYTLKEIGEKTELGKKASNIFSNRTVYKNVEDHHIRNIMELFNVDLNFLNKERKVNYFNNVVVRAFDKKKIINRKTNYDNSNFIEKQELKHNYSLNQYELREAIEEANKNYPDMMVSDGSKVYLNTNYKEEFEKIIKKIRGKQENKEEAKEEDFMREIKELAGKLSEKEEKDLFRAFHYIISNKLHQINFIEDIVKENYDKFNKKHKEIINKNKELTQDVEELKKEIENIKQDNKGFFAKLFKR